jgi:hypothetical protein
MTHEPQKRSNAGENLHRLAAGRETPAMLTGIF